MPVLPGSSLSGRSLPTGTVTFLFTDIEGSTRLWEQHPDAMRDARARHDAMLGAAIVDHAGVLVKRRGEGDSLFAVFARAGDAVAAALAAQRVLAAEPWGETGPLRVRMALHTEVHHPFGIFDDVPRRAPHRRSVCPVIHVW